MKEEETKSISEQEMTTALNRMKNGKAARENGIPAEIYKAR